MNRFTVVWAKEVEEPYLHYWINGDSQMRTALTEVATWVDSNLSNDPESKGRSGPEPTTRIVNVELASSPARVSVTYEIYPDDRLVRVVRLTFQL